MTDDDKIFELEEQNRVIYRARLARFRKWLRYLPRRSNISRYPIIRYFAAAAKKRPYLWAFGGPGVRRALYIGTVLSLLPFYGLQSLIAFWAAVLFRANLGITLVLQLITNPLTAGPIYYLTYRVGIWLIRAVLPDLGPPTFRLRIEALLVGGVVVGLAVAFLLDLVVRFLVWEAKRLKKHHQRVKAAADAARARTSRSADSPDVGKQVP